MQVCRDMNDSLLARGGEQLVACHILSGAFPKGIDHKLPHVSLDVHEIAPHCFIYLLLAQLEGFSTTRGFHVVVSPSDWYILLFGLVIPELASKYRQFLSVKEEALTAAGSYNNSGRTVTACLTL